MLPLLVVVVAAATPIRIAAPGFEVVGIEPKVADALLDRFVTQLGADGEVKVTTSRDIAQVLGLERQKELLGCTEEATNCLAELAGALGADVVLSGNLVKVGTGYTATLRFVGGRDGRVLASATERAKNLDALQDWLDDQAPRMVRHLRVALTPEEGPVSVSASAAPGPSPWPWVAVGGAAVVAGAGLGVFLSGKSDFTTLKDPATVDPERIRNLGAVGPAKQSAGVALLVAGGVGLAASLAWALGRTEETTVVGVAATPDGVLVGVQGRWP